MTDNVHPDCFASSLLFFPCCLAKEICASDVKLVSLMRPWTHKKQNHQTKLPKTTTQSNSIAEINQCKKGSLIATQV